MKNILGGTSLLLSSFLAGALLPQYVSGTQQTETCLTPACVKAAANILENLHPDYQKIDPCEDFGKYVCGGFPLANALAKQPDTLGKVQATNKYNLRQILEGPYPGSNSTSNADDKAAFYLVVKNYQSCMNAAASNSTDITGMKDIIQQIITRFPVNTTANGNSTLQGQDFDAFADTLAYLATVGIPVIGRFSTSPDPQVPNSMIPAFGANGYNLTDWALPARIDLSELLNVPVENMTSILSVLYQDSISNVTAAVLAADILQLSGKYYVIAQAAAGGALLEPAYHTSTISEAAKVAPALVLDKVIQKLVPSSYKLDRMLFQYPEAYANISAIVASTPKSTLQALMMIMAYQSYIDYLPLPQSPSTTADRWEICYQYVDTSLPWIASKFFLDAQYNEEARAEFTTQTVELKSAFAKRVDALEWMANDTKTLVKEKISKVKTLIGYPDENPNARNSTNLLRYYSPINITSSFFNNAMSIRRWDAQRSWQTLLVPVDTSKWLEWGVHSYIANARYYDNFNNMHLPAGFSQQPMYFQGAPSYLAYGGIGMISGHEITHGFDINGRQWNQNTQLKEWWDKDSEVAFANRTQCFIKQFSNFPAIDATGRPVLNETGQQAYLNGGQTLAENIADAGGLGNAWDAWRAHEAKNASQRLPGLEGFTKEQLFFLAAGQTWCSALDANAVLAVLATDSHAPPFARILNMQKNSAGFRETFQCKEKKPECQIW